MNEKKRKIFDGKMVTLISVYALLTLLLLAYFEFRGEREGDGMASLAHFQAVGSKLEAAGLNEQAAQAYEKYLSSGSIGSKAASLVAFKIGNLLEEAGSYERALSFYYLVGEYGEDGEHVESANKRVVVLLERLKRYHAAKYALKEKTSLSKEAMQGGTVVAQIEGRPIFLHQIEAEIDKLPETIKKQFSGKEGKTKFVQKYVQDELLANKARKVELDKEPEVQKTLANFEKQLLAAEMLKREIGDKVVVDGNDVMNFFKANIDKYKTKDKKGKERTPEFNEVRQRVDNDYRMEKYQGLYQQLMRDILKTEDVKLFLDKVK